MSVVTRGWRGRVRKLAPSLLAESVALATDDDVLLVDWVNRGPVRENWGDAVAPVIAGRLSGRRVVNRRDVINVRGRTVHTTIGSMLATIPDDGFEVWGSGFVHSKGQLQARPGRIHAVRGPLSFGKLREQGVDCPERFGDPAWIFPRLYEPEVDRTHALGIIPHYKEIDLPAVSKLRDQGAHIINIRGSITEVADEVRRCERIASSSLHGLVLADGYRIPAIWIRFSERPGGDGFKFRDYLASTNTRAGESLWVVETTTIAQVEDQFDDAPPEIDDEGLLDACPFLDRSRLRADGSVV